ncbi:MAG: TSCPD domain-containing protein, partial [Pseudobutyrivibrio sp.]|nr:TSCPD domain-containing protein [Pseudobutyrivibrio sp.]
IKFIRCKEDQNQINNFNLSVAITDEFMDDVINKSTREWAEDDEAAYTASDIYDMIVEHMWNNGEPGVQFIDTVNNVDGKYTGRPEFRDFNTGIEVSNPCVTGDTLVRTKDGDFEIETLVGKEVEVWNGDSWSKVVPFANTKKSPVITVSIDLAKKFNGYTKDEGMLVGMGYTHRIVCVKCTPDHTFIQENGDRIEACDLHIGVRLKRPFMEEDADYIVKGVDIDINNVYKTYCMTEPQNHAFTVVDKGNPILIGNCGETYLKPNEACNLASINLYHFVNPFWKGKDENKDMALRQELKQTVEDAVDFLNLMLDKSETPFPEINEAVHQSRKVGLGVMGLADYLSAKGIVYGSPEAVHEAADIFAFISKTAEEYSLRKGYKNATLTVQAPTGTTGLVGEVSTGIEPHFLRCWTRHSLKMGDLLMYPKSLRDYINARYDSTKTDSPEMRVWISLSQAMENNDLERFSDIIECRHTTTTVEAKAISDEIKKYWPTAHEVTPKQHLAMLAAIQRHVHNSVSKTINLSHDATVDDVRELITTAWRSGCKGFTCYRDGSRDSQPLKAVDSKGEDLEEISESAKDMLKKIYNNELQVIRSDRLDRLKEKAAAYNKFVKGKNVLNKTSTCKRPRPDTTYGETVKTRIGCGTMYITVNSDDNGICEVFTSLGRNGGCPSQSEATSRLISLALRSGVSVEAVIDQLKGIRCMNTMRQGGIKQPDGSVVLSCPDAIGKTMERVYKDKSGEGLFISKMRDATPEENASIDKFIESISVPTAVNIFDALECPECGEKLTRDGGCIICRHCGYSKCG